MFPRGRITALAGAHAGSTPHSNPSDLQTVSNPPARQILRRQLRAHTVTRSDPDPELAHLATGLADEIVIRAVDTNAIPSSSERLQDFAFDFYGFLFD